MLYPERRAAEAELEAAGLLNPGPWIDHSRWCARACERIAHAVPGMDAEKAYCLGLMHDIGRRVGRCKERHMLEGHRYCAERGWTDAARICITHSFMIKDVSSSLGGWDMDEQDYRYMERFVADTSYDDYDRLVQLCDSLALPGGFCLLEQRFVDVCMRYGANENLIPRWRATYDIKDDFSRRAGCPVYDLLPGIRESVFREA
ncbi:MAG TPA: HDOD domain-containing protein [Treponemataceae bacterium]|nr:HDOD domain-containing protein [Treponemataceae bacterium]